MWHMISSQPLAAFHPIQTAPEELVCQHFETKPAWELVPPADGDTPTSAGELRQCMAAATAAAASEPCLGHEPNAS